MVWSIGYDAENDRDIGYGVPALCDHPECNNVIDRGLYYVCVGCGLFFCADHLHIVSSGFQSCERCLSKKPPFEPKQDIKEWVHFKLHDSRWIKWREENPDKVLAMRKLL